MEDSDVATNINIFSKCSIQLLARRPPLAVILFTLCVIITLPALIFIFLTIVALFLMYIGLLEIQGEFMLYKIMFYGFLVSVVIVLLVTSGTILAWYYGLRRMYVHHFSSSTVVKKTPKMHTE